MLSNSKLNRCFCCLPVVHLLIMSRLPLLPLFYLFSIIILFLSVTLRDRCRQIRLKTWQKTGAWTGCGQRQRAQADNRLPVMRLRSLGYPYPSLHVPPPTQPGYRQGQRCLQRLPSWTHTVIGLGLTDWIGRCHACCPPRARGIYPLEHILQWRSTKGITASSSITCSKYCYSCIAIRWNTQTTNSTNPSGLNAAQIRHSTNLAWHAFPLLFCSCLSNAPRTQKPVAIRLPYSCLLQGVVSHST